MMKHCPSCGQDKLETEFYTSKQTLDGLFGYCKACVIERQHKYSRQNANKIKRYRKKNSLKRASQCRQWRVKNKDKVLQYKRNYETNRKKTDIGYRMLCNIRNRIRLAMKDNSKTSPTQKLIGCTITKLKYHLQAQFKSGMTWDNYGRTGWHIDHIRPCSLFDLSLKSEQRKCFHWTNLQPLWHTDNLRKSNHYPGQDTPNGNFCAYPQSPGEIQQTF